MPPSGLLMPGITGILPFIPKLAQAAKNDQGRAHTMRTGRIGVAVAAWLTLLAALGVLINFGFSEFLLDGGAKSAL